MAWKVTKVLTLRAPSTLRRLKCGPGLSGLSTSGDNPFGGEKTRVLPSEAWRREAPELRGEGSLQIGCSLGRCIALEFQSRTALLFLRAVAIIIIITLTITTIPHHLDMPIAFATSHCKV